ASGPGARGYRPAAPGSDPAAGHPGEGTVGVAFRATAHRVGGGGQRGQAGGGTGGDEPELGDDRPGGPGPGGDLARGGDDRAAARLDALGRGLRGPARRLGRASGARRGRRRRVTRLAGRVTRLVARSSGGSLGGSGRLAGGLLRL